MEFMTENVVSSLYPYQIEHIERQIIDYQSLNMAEKKTDFDMCPKCGAVHPRLIKAGNHILASRCIAVKNATSDLLMTMGV